MQMQSATRTSTARRNTGADRIIFDRSGTRAEVIEVSRFDVDDEGETRVLEGTAVVIAPAPSAIEAQLEHERAADPDTQADGFGGIAQ